jgi:hypothetical protein
MRYVAAALLIVALVSPGHAQAANRCQAAKIKATGKKVSDKARCGEKALRSGTAIAPSCLAKAEGKFTGAVAKADTLGLCAGAAIDLEAAVDQTMANFDTSLAIPATPNTSRCLAAKIKAAGEATYARARCQETAFRKGLAVDPLCLTKAGNVLEAAMAKADSPDPCPGTTAALTAVIDYALTTYGGLLSCPGGTEICSGKCVDTATDPQNCGACGTGCSINAPVCSGGACTCPPNYTNCGREGCVDLSSDLWHCGVCFGSACPLSGGSCVDGICTCPSPEVMCGINCSDLQSDNNNCGSCGHACPSGTSCQAGVCTCPSFGNPDIVLCGDACVNLKTDPNNCGSCGNYCREFTSCDNGTCRYPCPHGSSDCDLYSPGTFCCGANETALCDRGYCYPQVPDHGGCYHNGECELSECCCYSSPAWPSAPPGGGACRSAQGECPYLNSQCEGCSAAGQNAPYCPSSGYPCCSGQCHFKSGSGVGTCCNPAGYPATSCHSGADSNCCSNTCDSATNTCL